MGTENIWVSMPMFWNSTSTINIYKNIKNTFSYSTQAKHSPSNLPGQYFDNGFYKESIKFILSHLPSATSRICYQHKEVGDDSKSETRILGGNSRLFSNDIVSSSVEN